MGLHGRFCRGDDAREEVNGHTNELPLLVRYTRRLFLGSGKSGLADVYGVVKR